MIRRELAKDPKLATSPGTGSSPRSGTSEDLRKDDEEDGKVAAKEEARKASGLDASSSTKRRTSESVHALSPATATTEGNSLCWLESGEYFLKPHEREAWEVQQRKQKPKQPSNDEQNGQKYASLPQKRRPLQLKKTKATAHRNGCQGWDGKVEKERKDIAA
ncbi:uncharacterized protein BJ212DRAFT_1483608 [Suillus subaureus]|uniref:Uncharacterized protein n=1 Tax=Suillus subaureus TaxID=48587 RepID=A0A9P7JB34_9AGAM|nr:uncharacterized protein BJ212DRAFT_1483608 [Suillus subaureus]KAG1811908.1 hypothetical protein BJ212DRAFT_1483608 [Suillus subaureus]